MALFKALDISASGMTAQRLRMDTISENIANINTTRTAEGTPYTRKVVTFSEKLINPSFSETLEEYMRTYKGNGVRVSRIYEDQESEYVMEYDPSHPDADENGYVTYPNVNTVTEMTNLIDSSRAYQANVTAFNSMKSIASAGIQIGNA